MLITLHLCVLCGFQKKEYSLPYTSLKQIGSYNRSGESLLRGNQ